MELHEVCIANIIKLLKLHYWTNLTRKQWIKGQNVSFCLGETVKCMTVGEESVISFQLNGSIKMIHLYSP